MNLEREREQTKTAVVRWCAGYDRSAVTRVLSFLCPVVSGGVVGGLYLFSPPFSVLVLDGGYLKHHSAIFVPPPPIELEWRLETRYDDFVKSGERRVCLMGVTDFTHQWLPGWSI